MVTKTLSACLLLVVFHSKLNSQITSKDFKIADSLLRDSTVYYCKNEYGNNGNNIRLVRNEALVDHIYTVFNKVIVQNDDLVKNGTATNLTIDKESKLSGNVHFKKGVCIFNLGLAGNTTGNILNFFSNNSYNKGFTISGGIDVLTNKNSLIFDNVNCDSVKMERKIYFYKKLNELKVKYSAVDNIKIDSYFIKRIDSLEKLIKESFHNHFEKDSNRENRIRELEDSLEKTSTQKDSLIKEMSISEVESIKRKLDKDISSLDIKVKNISKLITKIKNDNFNSISLELKKSKDSLALYTEYKDMKDSLINSILKKIIDYDKEVVKLSNGYSLWWLKINASFSNQDYNIFDKSIQSSVSNDSITKDYFRNFTVSFSINYTKERSKQLWYGYLGLSVQNVYGLQGLIFRNDSFINKENLIVYKEAKEAIDKEKLKDLYDKQYYQLKFEGGFMYFWGAKKIIGVEANVSLLRTINMPETLSKFVILNARVGPVFSLSGIDKLKANGATLGLFLRFDNWILGENIERFFAYGVKLGIPIANVTGK